MIAKETIKLTSVFSYVFPQPQQNSPTPHRSLASADQENRIINEFVRKPKKKREQSGKALGYCSGKNK